MQCLLSRRYQRQPFLALLFRNRPTLHAAGSECFRVRTGLKYPGDNTDLVYADLRSAKLVVHVLGESLQQ
ncbi:hypothetical protein GA0115251_135318 [Streptomyces sp. TverLS-915]|nr:hypothetical protein GA0115251_135318 [Streptomyces sp. TverLS-915]